MSEEKKLGQAKLSESDAEKVSGGYIETRGNAIAHEIICPKCGNELEDRFETWTVEGEGEIDHFRCSLCGYEFTVDSYGYYDRG